MAYDESEVQEGVRDILAYMPREMRQRVLADYETRYAPFLNMLAGWKGAVQAHYAQGEESALNRLQEQFFPLGDWKFPAQGLAIPQRPAERTTDIPFGAEFKDPTGRPWIASGEGWVHPTALRDASLSLIEDEPVVQLEADYLGGGPVETLLERGQLAFVAAREEFIAALEACEWWVQTPNSAPRRAQVTRYAGYLAFEREMQTARLNQRQLDFWLPPCHPYARKIVRFRLLSEGGAEAAPDFLNWSGEVRAGFRLTGRLPNAGRRATTALRAESGTRNLFHLNPIPVIQTAMEEGIFFPPFPRFGSEYALRMSGLRDIFAAVVYNDDTAVPATLFRIPSNDPQAAEPDVQAQFAPVQSSRARVKIYYGSLGQGRGNDSDAPSVLEMTPLRFTVPFPVIGGVTVGGPETRVQWARTAWYQSVLRPPLLTEGDIVELLAQCQGVPHDLLRFRYAAREILADPEEGNVHWRSYLWPSMIAKADNFDARYGEIPAPDYIPLVQYLRLAFGRGPAAAGMPDFLLSDVANYLASVLSQYFVISCFRVEGRVV